MTDKIPKTHNGRPLKELKKAYIDFEYNHSTSERLNLVACCIQIEDGEPTTWWLDRSPPERDNLKDALLELRDDHVLVCFNADAEGSSLIALDLNPAKFAWIDLQVEYKMLLNHNDHWAYGNQLIKGTKRRTKPPVSKYERTERQKREDDNSKAEKSLAAACYKMLNRHLDTEHKDKMRDLIISCPKDWDWDEQDAVLKYCQSDVEVLPDLFKAIIKAFKQSTAKHAIKYSEICWRGKSSARTSLMSRMGYPVNPERVKNFSKAVPRILKDMAQEINSQFPDQEPFRWNKREGRFSVYQKAQRDWIVESDYANNWMMTDGGNSGKPQYSLSLDAWAKHFSYSHDYPQGNFPAQILRYLKTKQSLNGFMPKPKNANRSRKTFFDYYGPDARARAWLNPYGSQSSRFQPGATGFIPLKSAWMRSLIEPKPGFSICGIDYGSQEFLLAALLSKDKRMYESYASGDPYLAFAKLAGAVPEDGTRQKYELERDRFKSTCLAAGSLIRVRGQGYLPIEQITSEQEVWDGGSWRKSSGSQLMGSRNVQAVSGILATGDHKILTQEGWRTLDGAKKKAHPSGGLCFENPQRLRRPSASWSEVWRVGCRFLRDSIERVWRREI